ncbi:MAG TPA: hypothetical protein VEH06_08075 [Candidatus Bathyarchaeia archaeon]|nr:hypothetical protein [Candidatus Bathyarchaeia archaeon]
MIQDPVTKIYIKLTVDKQANEEGIPANSQTSPMSIASASGGAPNLEISPHALSFIQINNKSSVLEAVDRNVTTAKNTAMNITLRGTNTNPNSHMTASIITQPAHGTLSQINPQTGIVTLYPKSRLRRI